MKLEKQYLYIDINLNKININKVNEIELKPKYDGISYELHLKYNKSINEINNEKLNKFKKGSIDFGMVYDE